MHQIEEAKAGWFAENSEAPGNDLGKVSG